MPVPPAAPSSIARLESRALIAVGGGDWRSFLQGLLTQDVEQLAVGEIRFGALLTPQGRLLFDLFVAGREDGCWIDCAAEARDALIGRLAMYRLRAKVTLTPGEASVLAAWGAEPEGEGWRPDPRLEALGWRGYGLEAPTSAIEADYERRRLALGVPGTADLRADADYPIEADFDLLNGIDFHKGCFVGQETTSRMKRRGQARSRLAPIVFEGPAPPSGAEVLAGSLRAGETRSGASGRAMALLRLDRIAGAELTVDGRPCRADPPPWMAI